MPQVMQTESSGNTNTGGLSIFFRPGKCIATSAVSVCNVGEPHHLHCLVLTNCQWTDSGGTLLIKLPRADSLLIKQNSRTAAISLPDAPKQQKYREIPPSSCDSQMAALP